MEFHSIAIKECIDTVSTNESTGLSIKEAEKRLNTNGKNEIKEGKRKNLLMKFFAQFKDFMIIILLISAGVSFAVSYLSGEGEYFDFVIIVSIVVCNGIIGAIQESKAEKAIEALKNITSPTALVIRDGKKINIDSRLLVEGDVVIVKAGDVVPCDIRVIDSTELSCEESSLTGESLPVYKTAHEIYPPNVVLAERKNMLFSGCFVTSGYGRGIATACGMNTQIGKIAGMLENEKSPETPLQKKLNQAGKILGLAVMIICAIIFVLGLIKGIEIIEMMMIAISLAVAAIPEGLTAVVTIVLSLGVRRMATKKAIVRKLPAVETLGSVRVICSDKTGTLTENKMTVAQINCLSAKSEGSSEEKRLVLGLASLCSNVELNANGEFQGMPTEIAIVRAFESEKKDFDSQFPKIGEIPFTSIRKMMTTVHVSGDGHLIITKGAPDYILKKCTNVLYNGNVTPMTAVHKNKLEKINKAMADASLRVIAVAKKEIDDIDIGDDEIESELTFCGLIGLEDPPRKEAKKAVEMCKKAGIVPVMITGDQMPTAIAIAKRIGIFESDSKAISATEFSRFSDEELARNIHKYRVFARVSPEDKVKIVRAFQYHNQTIAMTGDGINDAPALKAADIGCAMGKNGTEVAKSAADMVLTDDNFATIVEAVKEGRGIFLNIKKTIHFLMSCNIGEILVIFSAFLLNLPIPLIATQILWVNLVTDSFPALALGSGKSEKNIMNGTFEEGKKGIFSKDMCITMILEGALIGIISLVAFLIGRNYFDVNPADPIIGRTMCFAVLCLSQLMHSFNVSDTNSIFSPQRRRNPWLFRSAVLCSLMLVAVIVFPPLSVAFKTVALSLHSWGIVIGLSIVPILVAEIEKAFHSN